MRTLGELADTLRADLERHLEPGRGRGLRALATLLESQGAWATAVYRLGQYVHAHSSPLVSVPGRATYRVASKVVELLTGISVPARARIGKGFYIGHFGTIIVHPDTVAGERLSIGQGVTVGTRGRGGEGVPLLGDDVFIGAGAKVLGPVRVGDGAAVGANAVVVHDVPPGAVVVGVPARAARRGQRRRRLTRRAPSG
jgi:serine O-acetyltransferase